MTEPSKSPSMPLNSARARNPNPKKRRNKDKENDKKKAEPEEGKQTNSKQVANKQIRITLL